MSKKNSWLELYMSCFLWAFGLPSTLTYLYRCCKICKYVYSLLNNASTVEKDAVGTTCFFILVEKIFIIVKMCKIYDVDGDHEN